MFAAVNYISSLIFDEYHHHRYKSLTNDGLNLVAENLQRSASKFITHLSVCLDRIAIAYGADLVRKKACSTTLELSFVGEGDMYHFDYLD